MKHLLIITIVFALLQSCSNRNEVTTNFLNQKKTTEDSIKDASNYELYYMRKAKEEMHTSHDSLKWQPLIDSSTYYFGKGNALREKLKAIDFSLVSLSRMK